MKSAIFISLSATILLLTVIHFNTIPVKMVPKETVNSLAQDSTTVIRNQITFIMGTDKAGSENPFYQSATEYYQLHPDHRESQVVTSCRSLVEVRDYLANTETDNCLPWGIVNIVVHGNQWSGIRTPVYKSGPRTTSGAILTAIREKVFLPLPEDKADGQTIIKVQACALGNDVALIEALGKAFGGNRDYRNRPKIVSPKHFVIYETGKKAATSYHQYLAASWYTFCPSDSTLHLPVLAGQLRSAYPQEDISWEDALKRENPRFPGDTYFHTFKIPVHWTITYEKEADRPVFKDEKAFLEWKDTQQELTSIMMKAGLPKEQFTWVYKNIVFTSPAGDKMPAIKVSGTCSVVCVLQYLPEAEGGFSDQRYYCVR
jgi:hypothetical protein